MPRNDISSVLRRQFLSKMFTKSTVIAKYSLLGVSCISIIRIPWKVSEQMSKSRFFLSRSHLLGLQPRDKAAMLWVNTKGGISYIPWCIASYYIIKLPNARDPISSHQFDRDATVEQQWKATCFADKTFCTFAVSIYLRFSFYYPNIFLVKSKRVFGRRLLVNYFN